MDTRDGQLNIAIHGAEVFELSLEPAELDDRNYKLTFLPHRTERRISDFDGVITFQRLYEQFKVAGGFGGQSTIQSCDLDELDKRRKEADILIKNGGFIVFILHAPFVDSISEHGIYTEYKDTDLVKQFLNWNNLYRRDFGRRLTSLRCVREEFNRFFELAGAAWSYFINYGSFPWRNLAFSNGQIVSAILYDTIFFIPCLLPRSEKKEEFFRLLADAVVTCVKKLRVELPAWADKFPLPRENTITTEYAELSSRLNVLKNELSTLKRFKRVLVGDSDALVEDVFNLLVNGFNLKVTNVDEYHEDIKIVDDNDEVVILGEIKGTTRGVKREYINQADSHRERAGLKSDFPTILIINTHTKNSRSLRDKNQAVPSEQIKHAVVMNVLVVRTIDLLNLLAITQEQSFAVADIMTLFKTNVGWLNVSNGKIEIRKD